MSHASSLSTFVLCPSGIARLSITASATASTSMEINEGDYTATQLHNTSLNIDLLKNKNKIQQQQKNKKDLENFIK